MSLVTSQPLPKHCVICFSLSFSRLSTTSSSTFKVSPHGRNMHQPELVTLPQSLLNHLLRLIASIAPSLQVSRAKKESGFESVQRPGPGCFAVSECSAYSADSTCSSGSSSPAPLPESSRSSLLVFQLSLASVSPPTTIASPLYLEPMHSWSILLRVPPVPASDARDDWGFGVRVRLGTDSSPVRRYGLCRFARCGPSRRRSVSESDVASVRVVVLIDRERARFLYFRTCWLVPVALLSSSPLPLLPSPSSESWADRVTSPESPAPSPLPTAVRAPRSVIMPSGGLSDSLSFICPNFVWLAAGDDSSSNVLPGNY